MPKSITLDSLDIEFGKLSKSEEEELVQTCLRGLENRDPRRFYQAAVAAALVGRDKRLRNPLTIAFKKSRGWKRRLVFEVVKYCKYDEKIGKSFELKSYVTRALIEK